MKSARYAAPHVLPVLRLVLWATAPPYATAPASEVGASSPGFVPAASAPATSAADSSAAPTGSAYAEAPWDDRVLEVADEQRIIGRAFGERVEQAKLVAESVRDTVNAYTSALTP